MRPFAGFLPGFAAVCRIFRRGYGRERGGGEDGGRFFEISSLGAAMPVGNLSVRRAVGTLCTLGTLGTLGTLCTLGALRFSGVADGRKRKMRGGVGHWELQTAARMPQSREIIGRGHKKGAAVRLRPEGVLVKRAS